MNLLSNAIKFTEDGTVDIIVWIRKSSKTKLRRESDSKDSNPITVNDFNDQLYVSVRDTGCGISQSDQNKLFKDFCTLKANAHMNPSGVGLGLSICKKIVSRLNGDITLQSELDQGSTFTFFVMASVLSQERSTSE